MIQTHKGVLYEKSRAYKTDFVVHVIDMKLVTMKIVTGFNSVKISTLAHDADLGFNNVGWGLHKRSSGVPNDLLWIEGRSVQNDPIDYRKSFFVNITKENEVRFDQVLRKPYNVIGFDRIIGRDNVFDKLITDASRAPRTIYVKDASGRLVILCCEGRAVDQVGLTFRECWDILHNGYVVTDAGNADGGYSTCAMNTALSKDTLINSYRIWHRETVSQTLFYAEPISSSVPVVSLSIGNRLLEDAGRINDEKLKRDVRDLIDEFPEVLDYD